MLRIALLSIGLFALPWLAYALWSRLKKRSMSDAPFYLLMAAGMFMALVGMVVIGQYGSTTRTGVYVPAEFRDGAIIPGHVETARPQTRAGAPDAQ